MLLLTALSAVSAATAGPCDGPFALQVLGSGGPEANERRASSGYLVWIEGKARILVDAGGGTFARFGASGARFADLDLIALTHLHADHAAELPALLKSGYFSPRSRPLTIAGPTAGGDYPDLEGYLLGLFGPRQGAFRYLSGYLDGSGGLVRLERLTLDAGRRDAMPVYSADGLLVTVMGVTHGPVPALAYRVDYEGRGIVLSGDQNGDDPEFVDFALGVDLLVMDHAVPENAGRVAANLHALPSEIANIARAAGAKQLVLSHIMGRSERVLEQSLGLIGKRYRGRISVAHDLMCVTL
jgi:ribonuclease BN (tRNA processing enzyme)